MLGEGVQLGEGASVGPFAVVGEGAAIGERTIVYPHVVIGRQAQIGDDCILHARVSIRERVRIGNRVIIQDGAIIGSDGFGFAQRPDGTHHKIPQIGGVVIEDDVEIGAQTAIDRPAVGTTRIGAGSKIDNLVQIAHGVTIGRNVLLAAQVGIAGSTTIEDSVTLAGQVGVAGHLTIGKGVIATAQTGIPNSVEAGAFVSGYPAISNRDWLKSSAVFRRLPELKKQVVGSGSAHPGARSATRRGLGGAALASPLRRPSRPEGPPRCAIMAKSLCIQAIPARSDWARLIVTAGLSAVLIVAAGSGTGAVGAASEARLHDDDAAERTAGRLSRRSLDAHRAHRTLVSRRVEEREAGPHRIRAPVRAHDVQGLEERRA